MIFLHVEGVPATTLLIISIIVLSFLQPNKKEIFSYFVGSDPTSDTRVGSANNNSKIL
jgi:hypothetical protein